MTTIWPKENISIDGTVVETTAPIIISASRAADIPAFYAKSFVDQFKRGFLFWTNPFNGIKMPISLKKVRLIVFWTKNAEPIIPMLSKLDDLKIDYYFNYTLNNYDNERLENNSPSLETRINTFIRLSEKIGKEKIIWRFDPIVLLKNQTNNEIIDKIAEIANKLYQFTDKLVFSFIDTNYKKVQQNLIKSNIEIKLFNENDKYLFANKLSNKLSAYRLKISTCAESLNLLEFGIEHNKCIDDELIMKLFRQNEELIQFVEMLKAKNKIKDKGQREFCNCIPSKDIGRYNTCRYSCTYCYAGHYNSEGGKNISLFD